MRIESSSLQMAAQHAQTRLETHRERLELRIGAAPRPPVAADDAVKLSDVAQTRAAEEAGDEAAPPALRLLKQLIEQLTGRKIRIFDATELSRSPEAVGQNPPAPAVAPSTDDWSLRYDAEQQIHESEGLHVGIEGVIRTQDGRELHFQLGVELAREYVEESTLSIRAGAAARTKDPLVLNFNGDAATLSDQRIRFDLDADGAAEEIPFVGVGSGFLAFDRNHDGVINDGRELFGARTGDGFAELAALDADDNGWIDTADPAYAELSVWRKLGTDPALQSLAEADVGAIAVNALATPFSYRNTDNAPLAELRATGVYLRESGSADTIQQLDFVV